MYPLIFTRTQEVQGPNQQWAVPVFCPVPAGRADVGDGLPGEAAAGVLPHAAGVALRFHRLAGTLPVRPGAADVVEEV